MAHFEPDPGPNSNPCWRIISLLSGMAARSSPSDSRRKAIRTPARTLNPEPNGSLENLHTPSALPPDYHRFHSPVNGTITHIWSEGGTLLSVNADAAQSKNKVFLNTREIVVIDSTCCGKVAYIAIAATCVGSVVLYKDAACTTTLRAGDQLASGDQMGIMQFGGSTVHNTLPLPSILDPSPSRHFTC